ncbi:MAG: hypothetical protein COA78_21905 [Blastopirellula sp.]|nr:MAG: hypothetical protein COA78_21905 [Blastopirellula sp.]
MGDFTKEHETDLIYTWKLSEAVSSGDIRLKDKISYQAQSAISSGVAFSEGTEPNKWAKVGRELSMLKRGGIVNNSPSASEIYKWATELHSFGSAITYNAGTGKFTLKAGRYRVRAHAHTIQSDQSETRMYLSLGGTSISMSLKHPDTPYERIEVDATFIITANTDVWCYHTGTGTYWAGSSLGSMMEIIEESRFS